MSVIMNVLNTVRQENEEKEVRGNSYAELREEEEFTPAQNLAEKMNTLNAGVIEEERLAAAGGSGQALAYNDVTQDTFFVTLPSSKTLKRGAIGILISIIIVGLISFFVVQIIGSTGKNESELITRKAAAPAAPSTSAPISTTSKSLQGIILEPNGDPYCILEGAVLTAGDYWRGSQITSITSSGVTLSRPDGSSFFLQSAEANSKAEKHS